MRGAGDGHGPVALTLARLLNVAALRSNPVSSAGVTLARAVSASGWRAANLLNRAGLVQDGDEFFGDRRDRCTPRGADSSCGRPDVAVGGHGAPLWSQAIKWPRRGAGVCVKLGCVNHLWRVVVRRKCNFASFVVYQARLEVCHPHQCTQRRGAPHIAWVQSFHSFGTNIRMATVLRRANHRRGR